MNRFFELLTELINTNYPLWTIYNGVIRALVYDKNNCHHYFCPLEYASYHLYGLDKTESIQNYLEMGKLLGLHDYQTMSILLAADLVETQHVKYDKTVRKQLAESVGLNI